MMRACSNILLEMFPCFGNWLIRLLLESKNLSTKGVGCTYREELLEESVGTVVPGVDSFTVCIEPLLRPHEQGEREEAKTDGIQ